MVPIDPNTFNTNTAKTVYAGSKGVCIKRNGTQYCFRGINYIAEPKHVQEVFSDVSCFVDSYGVLCHPYDFDCYVSSIGEVVCTDLGPRENCAVYSRGSVSCS